MTHETQDQQKQQTNVRTYQPPRLLVYGAMRELTASGTSGDQEKGGSTGNEGKRP